MFDFVWKKRMKIFLLFFFFFSVSSQLFGEKICMYDVVAITACLCVKQSWREGANCCTLYWSNWFPSLYLDMSIENDLVKWRLIAYFFGRINKDILIQRREKRMPNNCSTLIQRKQNILHKILRSNSDGKLQNGENILERERRRSRKNNDWMSPKSACKSSFLETID